MKMAGFYPLNFFQVVKIMEFLNPLECLSLKLVLIVFENFPKLKRVTNFNSFKKVIFVYRINYK